ncbi:MAG: FkbM family methyltransferase [Candidatus Omnitrophota bacterium]
MIPVQLKLRLWTQIFRKLPNFKGKTRLANIMLGGERDISDVQVKAFDGSYYLIPSLGEFLGLSLFATGCYEKEEVTFILDRLRSKDGFFLDIGANIGLYSITAAKALAENSKIVAVEASPRIFTYLAHNAELNRSKGVRLLQCAVTDEDNSCICFTEPPATSFAMGSITDRFGKGDKVSVGTKTIDTIIEEERVGEVSAVKIDIEGYEAAAFKGAKKLLSGKNAPLILFEFLDWAENNAKDTTAGDAQRILRDAGYDIWKFKDYIDGKKPLSAIVKEGSLNLVAVKNGN